VGGEEEQAAVQVGGVRALECCHFCVDESDALCGEGFVHCADVR